MEKAYAVHADGCNIRCKLYAPDKGKISGAVIFGHGFGGHKDNKAAARFAERVLTKYKETAVITFDWPVHGDDVRKKLRLEDCDRYLTLVIQDARERLGASRIYGYATSFGGYLFLKYIHDHGSPFDKLVLRCPAVCMADVMEKTIAGRDEMDKLKKGKDVLVGFDRKVAINEEFLRELRAADITAYDYIDWAEDILILHGTADEVVPMAPVQAFADEQVIEFIPIEGADHRFHNPLHMDTAIQKMLDFLKLT